MYPSSALWRAAELSLLDRTGFPGIPAILDLGCGDGYFSNALFSSKGLRVDAGMDVSLRYVIKAVKNSSQSHVYKSLLVGSAVNLPYKDRSFGIVFSNCVIEHIPNVQSVLSEIQRVLKMEGRLIFTVPTPYFGRYSYIYKLLNKAGSRYLAELYRSSIDKRLDHYNIHDVGQWEVLLSQAGLKLEFALYYIKPETARICDLLEFIYTRGIWKIRLNALLIRGSLLLERIGIKFHKKIIIALYYKFLKKYLAKEEATDHGRGAALLIMASINQQISI